MQVLTERIIAVKTDTQPVKPPLFRVIMLNDDYTPMDFVVGILSSVFHFDSQEATRLMFEVHYQGRAICGIFPKDIADSKIDHVHRLAKQADHPLRCVAEKI